MRVRLARPVFGTVLAGWLTCFFLSAGAVSEITGVVRSTDGTPIRDVFVGVLDDGDTVVDESTKTDANGQFSLTSETDNKFLTVRPPLSVDSEGYDTYAFMPRTYGLQNEDTIEIVLPPAGALVVRAHGPDGNVLRMTDFEEMGTLGGQFMFVANVDRQAIPANYFGIHDNESRANGSEAGEALPGVIIEPGFPRVLQLMFWDTPYGKLLLEADNGGEGFTVPTSGVTRVIDINVEFAKTAVDDLLNRRDLYTPQGQQQVDELANGLSEVLSISDPVDRAAAADELTVRALRLRDVLELELARNSIENVRQGLVSILVVDEAGEPIPGATVEIQQSSNDFIMGAFQGGGDYDAPAWEAAREAGFEMATRILAWGFVEEDDGDLIDGNAIDFVMGISELEDLGYQLKSHANVYLQQDFGILPDRALEIPWQEVYSGILEHELRMLNLFSDRFFLWETINEPAQTNGVGMPADQIVNLMADSAAQIKSFPGNKTIVNAVHEINFGRKFRFYDSDNLPRGTEKTLTTYSEYLDQAQEAGAMSQVDIIGVQFYSGFQLGQDFNAIEGPAFLPSHLADIGRVFHRFARPLHITEFSIPSNYEDTWRSGYWRERWTEQTQADYTEAFLTQIFADPFFESFTWWDVTDNRSSLLTGGLLDDEGRPKPVLHTIERLLDEWSTHTSGVTAEDGVAEFFGYAGDYDVMVTLPGGGTVNANFHVSAREQARITLSSSDVTAPAPPAAENIRLDTPQTGPLEVRLPASGAAKQFTYTILEPPMHGVLEGTPPNLVYTPDSGFSGEDSFRYEMSNENGATTGTVNLLVRSAPDEKPEAAFNYEIIGRTVMLTNQSTDDGSISSVNWNLGDGTVSDVTNPNHTYARDGLFGVTLIVEDNAGQASAVTRNIRIKLPDEPPAASFEFEVSGSQVFFRDTSTDVDGEIVFWQWTFGDSSDPVNEQNPTHEYSGPGEYTVTLFVSDEDGDSDSITQKVAINFEPRAVFFFEVRDFEVIFSDFSFDPNGSIAAWDWDFGDGNGSTASNPVHTYSESGQYVVRLTVTDSNGVETSTQKTVTIEPLNMAPTADFAYEARGLTAAFEDMSTDSDGEVVFRHWVFGDGSDPSNETNPVHAYAAPGEYMVTLFVSDDEGASDTLNRSIIVEAPPEENAPPVPDFSYTVSGTTVTFNNESTDSDGEIAFHHWLFGDGSAPVNESDPVHEYGSPGEYTVTLFVADDDGAGAGVTRPIVVNRPPTAIFVVGVNHQEAIFSDFSFDVEGPIVSWLYDFGDGSTSSEQNPVHTYDEPGTYTVTLTVTDEDGAVGETQREVTIEPANNPPTANFSYEDTGTRVEFTDSSEDSDGDVVFWTWVFGDDSPPVETRNPVHTYNLPGEYTVTLFVMDNEGGTDMTQTKVEIGAFGQPVITLRGPNPILISVGEPFTDPGAVARSPEFGNLTGRIVVTGEVDVNTAGTYRLVYNVSDRRGTAATPKTRTVFVEPEEPSSRIIGPGGGEVNRPGVTVVIGSNGLGQNSLVRVDRSDPPSEEERPPRAKNVLDTAAYIVDGLGGLDTDESAEITLEFADGDNDGIVDDSTIDEAFLVAIAINTITGETLVIPGELDTESNLLTIRVPAGESWTIALADGSGGLCGIAPFFGQMWSALREDHPEFTEDLDSDGLPDDHTLALIREVLCDVQRGPLFEATVEAYFTNRDALEDAPGFSAVGEHADVLAFLLAAGRDLQEAALAVLGGSGVDPQGPFVSVRGQGEDKFLASTDTPDSSDTEPYVGTGNPDEDETSNRMEFENISARNGGPYNFADVAFDPLRDGSEQQFRKRGCSAGSAHGGAGGGDDLIVLLAMSLMLVLRKRRSGQA